jgi:hypothetical protein
MRLLIVLACILPAAFALAETRFPIEFDRDPLWEPRPTFLPNPADRPSIDLRDGVVALAVREAGKGMKFELRFRPFDIDRSHFLVLRYKASALGPGYAIWVNDDHPGGLQLAETSLWQADDDWHVLAVDLYAAGARGAISSILTEVQCVGAPASISFDYVCVADEAPPGAAVMPAGRPASADAMRVIRGRDLQVVNHPTWLAAPADKFSADVEDGALHLSARGAGRGMKFSAPISPPLDLASFRYAALRYRARGLEPWGDYFVYLGSAPGGMPPQFTTVVPLCQLRDDGDWHVVILPLAQDFTAADMALQVSSRADQGDVWLDTITFSARRPKLAPQDVLALVPGWSASRLKPGSFRAIDLSRAANASAEPLMRQLGYSRWLDAGKFTVRGIPFDLPAGEKSVLATTDNIDDIVTAPVDAAGSELYVLMTAALPDTANAGVLGRAPLLSFSNPERFVFQVRYADGLTDDHVPVCLSSGANQVFGGPEVYCLPALRKVAVKSLALRSRMESAVFAVSALTVNTGAPLVKVPEVPGLPPYAAEKPAPAKAKTPDITRIPGGYRFESYPLALDLATDNGISLRGLTDASASGLEVTPGPLFELAVDKTVVSSDRLTTVAVAFTQDIYRPRRIIAFDGSAAGLPLRGDFHCQAMPGGEIRLLLNLTYTGDKPATVAVHFPILRGLRLGAARDTWYLYACKGGVISNRPISQARWYGGEYPLQVADVFNPAAGRGLALMTYDTDDLYKQWRFAKDDRGIDWGLDYWPREFQPGEAVPVAQTALRAHSGDWRAALRLYRKWVAGWYSPPVPRKQWFRECFNYRQHMAWGELYDARAGVWRMPEVIKADRDFFGRLDYLHIFDFGESHVYGRVGDYNHYEELGGLDKMAAAIAYAKAQGVPLGLYIEGYLCDDRAQWGRDNVLASDIRGQDGKWVLFPGTTNEHMMCSAATGWRKHLAAAYGRVAAELKPSGMYIDEYGFGDTWKTCWSREHGHPVPWPPISGEADTTRAIRAAIPPDIANLTEETPNDFNSQFQDGALGYSIASTDPALAPHRIDLFRFQFPDFKVFQLVSYNNFVEGGWDLLKWPFFNADGTWLGNGIPDGFSTDARDFLRQAFAILHEHRDAFTSDDVDPLVPTLRPTVYANRFTAGAKTVWTLFNAEYSTFRGDILRVPHRPGAHYFDAFTGAEIKPRINAGYAVLAVVLGPQAVGCIVCR